MKRYYLLLSLFFVGLIWSAIDPINYFNYIGEVLPAVVGAAILIFTFRQFRFTFFSYVVLLIACYFIFTGAHYSYAKVPLFDYIRDYFGHSRNNFDRVGHFIQGIIPVLLTREYLIKKKIVTSYNCITFLSLCVCMATTSCFELIEALACWISGQELDIFLGTQGDKWDSQSDMMVAVAGGLITLFLFRKYHDLIIEKEFPGATKHLANN